LEQTRHVRVAKSERPMLTNGEIIFEEFQPMWSQFTNVTDGWTDGRTDGQTTCDRNTALCTKVHRAVKTAGRILSINTSNDAFLAKDVPFGISTMTDQV